MKWLNQSTAKGFAMPFFPKKAKKRSPVASFDQSFILEPILTPSGIVDGSDDTDPSALALTLTVDLDDINTPEENSGEVDNDTDTDFDYSSDVDIPDSPEVVENSLLDSPIPDTELDFLEFATFNVDGETLPDTEPLTSELETPEFFTDEIETPDSDIADPVDDISESSLDADEIASETEISDSDIADSVDDISESSLDAEEVASETETSDNDTTAPVDDISEDSVDGNETDIASEESEISSTEDTSQSDRIESPSEETSPLETNISDSDFSENSVKQTTSVENLSDPESGDAEISINSDASEVIDGENLPESEADSANNENSEEIDPLLPSVINPQTDFTFESGVFTVGETGVVGIDYLFDGGAYKGELGMFSLEGMNEFEPGSEAFIQEAARRALSESELGHVVINDIQEGARFNAALPHEGNFDSGEYLGVKTFTMRTGDSVAFMLIPRGTVQQIFENPGGGGSLRPLFSLATANPNDMFHAGQIADVTGEGNTFVFEDLRVDGNSDRDYNDIVFQVRGARGEATLMESVIDPSKDWRGSDMGQALLAYTQTYITPDPVDSGLPDLLGELDDLDSLLNPPVEAEQPNISDPGSPDLDADLAIDEPEGSNPDAPETDSIEDLETPPSDSPEPIVEENSDAVGETPEASPEPVLEGNSESDAVETPEASPEPAVEENSDAVGETPEASPEPVIENPPESDAVSETPEIPQEPAVEDNSEADTVGETPSEQLPEANSEDSPSAGIGEESSIENGENHLTPDPQENTANQNSETPDTPVIDVPRAINSAEFVTRIENFTTSLRNPEVASAVGSEAEVMALTSRLERLTQTLSRQETVTPQSAIAINNLLNRVEMLSSPPTPSPVTLVSPPNFTFAPESQPLVGIIDTGFSGNNPDINYSRVTLGRDWIDGDNNPTLAPGEGNEHGTHILGLIAAQRDNGIGIDGINPNAPIWAGRAVGSGKWADSLVEFVNAAKESGQPNAVITINPNLTEIYEDGTVGVRYELTDAEWEALAYANKHNILVVVPAGNNGEFISALGETSLNFDNIITVGTAQRINDATSFWKSHGAASNSPSGFALNILADGTNDEISTTAVSAGKVAGAVSQVWAANPKLSHREVIDILQRTATDLNAPDWDFETGSGLLNIAAAVHLAKATKPLDIDVPIRWLKFEKSNQPLIGVIDTGFNGSNPDIDYSRVTLGRDHVDSDDNPLFEGDEGNEHGTHVLGIIAATQDNGIGIDGINDQAPIWLGRAVGSGKWAESLREFVDAAKASGQSNAVVNLSFDLTQTNPDGTVTTRYELTPQEREALEYARQNGVLVVVAAGNDSGTMSALGQASQEFDNLITVGSIDHRGNRADYSNFGYGLDLVARGGTTYNPVTSTVGQGTDLKTFLEDSGDEAEEDEMSLALQAVFEEEFGEFYNPDDSESSSELPDDWTDDERQAYEEAIKAIDDALAGYEEEALQKVGMEFISNYLGIGVEASEEFLNVFNEDAIDSLIKAEEILGDVLENGEPALKAGLAFSSLSDLDVDEDKVDEELLAELMGLDFSIDSDLDMGTGEMAGTSVAAAKVTGAVSKVWAANPDLSYKQVKEILKATAVDLGLKGWDKETGSGLVDIAAAVALAKETQPEAHTPQPILSPLTWSGAGAVIPGERPVRVTVPSFTGRVMNAGYVIQTGWLRVRSGPGTGFSEVGLVYPGNAIQFDAYENNGTWVPDPYMPGGGSSRWYRIAGTNNWVSALYIDNTPEIAEEERKRQEAIGKAEEEARRAEAEARRLEEEARRAEEELRRLEEEARRLEEEARRQAEEEARRRAAQLAAAIAEWAPKVGALGTPLGSFISNGVTVYKFAQGALKIQPDGRSGFYESVKKGNNGLKVFQKIGGVYNQSKTIRMLVDSKGAQKLVLDASKNPLLNPLVIKVGNSSIVSFSFRGKNYPLNPLSLLNTPEFASKHPKAHTALLKASSALRGNSITGITGFKNTRKFLLTTKSGKFVSGFAKNVTKLARRNPLVKLAGKAAPFLTVGTMVLDRVTAKTDEEKRRSEVQLGASLLAGAIGTAVGTPAVGMLAMSTTSLLFDAGYFAADKLGFGDDIDKFFADSYSAVGNAFNSTKSAVSDALKAAREKAAAAREKAEQAVQAAKATVKAAAVKVEQAKAAYNTFKQQTQQAVSNLVQQSTQKFKTSLQQAKQAVVQKVAQAAPRVIKQVAQYAQKAVNTVRNVVNGAKQVVNNVINKGKEIVSNVINKGKQAVQAVTNFVSNTASKVQQATAHVYNQAAQQVKNAKNAVSGAVKRLKFW